MAESSGKDTEEAATDSSVFFSVLLNDAAVVLAVLSAEEEGEGDGVSQEQRDKGRMAVRHNIPILGNRRCFIDDTFFQQSWDGTSENR